MYPGAVVNCVTLLRSVVQAKRRTLCRRCVDLLHSTPADVRCALLAGAINSCPLPTLVFNAMSSIGRAILGCSRIASSRGPTGTRGFPLADAARCARRGRAALLGCYPRLTEGFNTANLKMKGAGRRHSAGRSRATARGSKLTVSRRRAGYGGGRGKTRHVK